MGKVTWAPSGVEDIVSIALYIGRDSEDQAGLFVQRVLNAVKRLADLPLSGRQIPEYSDPMRREIIVGVYRVMYQIDGHDISITGVIHGARDFRP